MISAPVPAAPERTGAPDAILHPNGWIDPANPQKTSDRIGYLADLFRPILGLPAGTKLYFKQLVGYEVALITVHPDPQGTINFNTGHVYEGQPRYDWVPQENGLSYGYFRPDPARV